MLRRFWEMEDCKFQQPALSLGKQIVVYHLQDTHRRDQSGRFIIPLPLKTEAAPLGGSRALAVRRFMALECSLRIKDQSQEFSQGIRDYFNMNHAEAVLTLDLAKPYNEVYYLLMHVVR